MVYSLIIKDNIVINKTVGNSVRTDYPFPYDLILEDVNKNVGIGSTYNPLTGEFSDLKAPYEEEQE
jgi:hypothetical protein